MKASENNYINECIVAITSKHTARVERKCRRLVSGRTTYLTIKRGQGGREPDAHEAALKVIKTILSFFPESYITSGLFRRGINGFIITVVLLPNK